MFALGIIGLIFTVFHYFKNPQIDQDKRDALLAQQVNWQNEATDRRFKEMQESFQGLTVDTKVDKMAENVNLMSNEITKLATIISERIPKK